MREGYNPGIEHTQNQAELAAETVDRLITHALDLSEEIKALSDAIYEKIHDEAKKREIKAKMTKTVYWLGTAVTGLAGAVMSPVGSGAYESGLKYVFNNQTLEDFVSNPDIKMASIPILAASLVGLVRSLKASIDHSISETRLSQLQKARSNTNTTR